MTANARLEVYRARVVDKGPKQRPMADFSQNPSAALILGLQRSAGNAAVAGRLTRKRSSTIEPSQEGVTALQRCGPTPCNCSNDERADYAAREDESLHVYEGGQIPLQRAPARPLMLQREVKQEGEAGRRPDLWLGDTGPAVRLLQSRLAIAQTGVFDEKTRLAVVEFRKATFGESNPAGGVGPATWQKLDERAGAKAEGTPGNRPNLWLGDTGPAVRLLQRLLSINQTGVFDEPTRLEVVRFRKAEFKEADPAGGVGPMTWQQLDKMMAKSKETGVCGGWHPCSAPANCDVPDGAGGSDGTWQINIAIDLEAAGAIDVEGADQVGHAYVEFKGADGRQWSYGFYNDPTDPAGKPDPMRTPKVMGCVVHPDRIHEPCVDHRQQYPVSEEGYKKALAFAQLMCRVPEKYDLLNFNCTTFAAKIVEKADGAVPYYRGKVGGQFTADNPYALMASLQKDVPTRNLTDADKIHDWLGAHSYDDIAKLPEAEKKRLIREVLTGWVREKDLESVEWVCKAVKDRAEMERIDHEIHPIAKDLFSEKQKKRLEDALALRPM